VILLLYIACDFLSSSSSFYFLHLLPIKGVNIVVVIVVVVTETTTKKPNTKWRTDLQ